jgi:hypothetical protein
MDRVLSFAGEAYQAACTAGETTFDSVTLVETLYVAFSSQNRNPAWFKWVVNRNSILRAQVHAGHSDHLKYLARI